jgi:LCP family protein required for cell wall assembly
VEATVYRRGSDGKVIGTPEVNPAIDQTDEPIFSVTTFRSGEVNQTQTQPRVSRITLPKFSARKSKSRYPRPVRYIRNIVLAYLGFYLVLGFHAASSLEKIPASANVALADTAGTNWLLVGSDSREGLTEAERKELHTGQDEGSQRTDTIMVIHVGDNGKPTLISLPRDSYVIIPAHIALDGSSIEDRKNKINTAYSKGGVPLLVETVERNTGLHIDHYMQVGFKGIRDITNAVGGVNMCVPADVTDKNSGLN